MSSGQVTGTPAGASSLMTGGGAGSSWQGGERAERARADVDDVDAAKVERGRLLRNGLQMAAQRAPFGQAQVGDVEDDPRGLGGSRGTRAGLAQALRGVGTDFGAGGAALGGEDDEVVVVAVDEGARVASDAERLLDD